MQTVTIVSREKIFILTTWLQRTGWQMEWWRKRRDRPGGRTLGGLQSRNRQGGEWVTTDRVDTMETPTRATHTPDTRSVPLVPRSVKGGGWTDTSHGCRTVKSSNKRTVVHWKWTMILTTLCMSTIWRRLRGTILWTRIEGLTAEQDQPTDIVQCPATRATHHRAPSETSFHGDNTLATARVSRPVDKIYLPTGGGHNDYYVINPRATGKGMQKYAHSDIGATRYDRKNRRQ